jgi:sugar lactone lactonase YvrE
VDLGDAAPDGICVDAENAVWYAEVLAVAVDVPGAGWP